MEKIITEESKNNKGHYVPGVVSNGLLFVSGQLSRDPVSGAVPEGGIEEHVRLALKNMEKVLKQAGCTRSDVIQCRVYITDIEYWNRVNKVYAEFFGEHKPARIIVPVPALHFGCLTEIEAVAEVK